MDRGSQRRIREISPPTLPPFFVLNNITPALEPIAGYCIVARWLALSHLLHPAYGLPDIPIGAGSEDDLGPVKGSLDVKARRPQTAALAPPQGELAAPALHHIVGGNPKRFLTKFP